MALLVLLQYSYPPWNGGETVSLPDLMAQRLVGEGLATPVGWTADPFTEAVAEQQFQGGAAAAEAGQNAVDAIGVPGVPANISGHSGGTNL